jgi:GntR family transcriptional regulator/MocR family aminotransferase
VAQQFSFSRNSVLLTYERLIAEGYLEAPPAKGPFVARFAVVRLATHRAAGLAEAQARFPVGARDSTLTKTHIAGGPVAVPRRPSADLAVRCAGQPGGTAGTAHPAGSPVLRIAIADWLATSRGLAVAPEQVIVMNGRQQPLHMVAHLALRPGARLVVEDLCDPDAAATLVGEAAALVRVPVDADGCASSACPPQMSPWCM